MAANSKKGDSYNKYINSGQYNYSSQALQLEPAIGKEYGSAPKRPRSGQKKVKRGSSMAPLYSIEIARPKSGRFMKLLTFATVFIGAFLSVFSMAYIESRKLDYSGLQDELKQLKVDNIILQGEVLSNYNQAEVERYAVNVLGMVKPQESQIVYVDEVKISYMEQYDAPEENIEPFQILKNMLNSVKNLIWTEDKPSE